MKKIFLSLLLVFGCIMMNGSFVNAEEYYYEEEIVVIEDNTNARATSTKTAKKTASYKNSSGSKLWSVTVTGKFTYNGKTSSCTSSSVSATSYDSNWKISSKSSSKTGSTAIGKATAKLYLDGSYISSLTKTVKLTCDKNGKLS